MSVFQLKLTFRHHCLQRTGYDEYQLFHLIRSFRFVERRSCFNVRMLVSQGVMEKYKLILNPFACKVW